MSGAQVSIWSTTDIQMHPCLSNVNIKVKPNKNVHLKRWSVGRGITPDSRRSHKQRPLSSTNGTFKTLTCRFINHSG